MKHQEPVKKHHSVPEFLHGPVILDDEIRPSGGTVRIHLRMHTGDHLLSVHPIALHHTPDASLLRGADEDDGIESGIESGLIDKRRLHDDVRRRWRGSADFFHGSNNSRVDDRVESAKPPGGLKDDAGKLITAEVSFRGEDLRTEFPPYLFADIRIAVGEVPRDFVGKEDGAPQFAEAAARSGLPAPYAAGDPHERDRFIWHMTLPGTP